MTHRPDGLPAQEPTQSEQRNADLEAARRFLQIDDAVTAALDAAQLGRTTSRRSETN